MNNELKETCFGRFLSCGRSEGNHRKTRKSCSSNAKPVCYQLGHSVQNCCRGPRFKKSFGPCKGLLPELLIRRRVFLADLRTRGACYITVLTSYSVGNANVGFIFAFAISVRPCLAWVWAQVFGVNAVEWEDVWACTARQKAMLNKLVKWPCDRGRAWLGSWGSMSSRSSPIWLMDPPDFPFRNSVK